MNACPGCGEVMDVSSCDPYSKVICPECSTAIRVRADFLHFRIEKKIGEGGLSRVFQAIDQTLNRQVALKVLSPEFSKDSQRALEFEREARITASISHPNVVKVYSAGRDQDHYFMAMELVNGGSLDQLIHKKGKIVERRALKIGAELVRGLQAAHKAGLIHRDVKPGNILFSEDGVSKIVDFGLARREVGNRSDDGEMWATPFYVPPEKLYGAKEDFRSDVYSLGATLFHALVGKPPCSSDTSSIDELKLLKQKKTSLEVNAPNISISTCDLIDRMMDNTPSNRHESYDELLNDFENARSQLSQTSVKLIGSSLRLEKSEKSNIKRKITTSILFVILFLGVLGVLGVLVLQDQENNKKVIISEDLDEGLNFIDINSSKQTVTGKFYSGVEMMVASDYGAAEREFAEIASFPEVLQPTLNWALFNQGLSLLLQGDLERARIVYQRLEERSVNSDGFESQGLKFFFRKSSQLLSQRKAISYDQLANYEGKSYESIALLAFGLQNWQHEDFDDAEEYLRSFSLHVSPENYPWIEDLKLITTPYLKDIDLFRKFPTIRENPNSNDVLTALNVSEEIIELVVSQKIKNILNDQILNYQKLSEKLVTEEAQEVESRMAKLRIEELQKMILLRKNIQSFSTRFQFYRGLNMIELVRFTHPEFIQKKVDRLEIWKSSESFIQRIVNDINRFNYRGPILTNEGSSRILKIISADRDQFTYSFGEAQGKAKVSIEQVSASSLIAMSVFFDRNINDREILQERMQERVLFLYLVGRLSQSSALSGLVEDKQFQLLWSRILEFERNS